ncbi:MAG TPA: hypothetical protein PLU22_23630 [Polyangiaceae bacterium]|nr:hypothetical protein [Polyangiaceae bacterium]
MSLPRSLAWLFPEYALRDLDAERDSRLVLARLLEQGRLEDVSWAVRHYGLERIHRFLRDESSPELSPRTIAIWRAALQAKHEPWATSRRSRLRNAAPWPG